MMHDFDYKRNQKELFYYRRFAASKRGYSMLREGRTGDRSAVRR